MSSAYLPSYTTPQPQHGQHQSRSRYYASRVKESWLAKCLCAFFLTLPLIVAVTIFVLSLIFRPYLPHFHLSSFSAPGLAQSTGPINSALSFNITDRNSNHKTRIYYDSIYASVFYNDTEIGAGPVLFPFYQPPKNTTVLLGTLTAKGPTTRDSAWDQLSADVAAGQVKLNLKLTLVIRFQVKLWDTHQEHMQVECDFAVGKDGNILSQSVDESCTLYF
ncbi:hypothetical protein LUZ61_018565 [Rhynchospora tenuis]|uniref:Late embryogenesis abundant protein LEA-2 subgroup domain-containing protein n=1 Tax=Rhynchospora tenuis TaxID=198213 RepID=A0AAD6EM39_9POAL|nr:hypothetical protein LUZ61_018565 [Rhynchospora tenuis]